MMNGPAIRFALPNELFEANETIASKNMRKKNIES